VDKKIFIYIAICFGIFIAGALSGGVGIYIYSKRGMENLRNRVSELETYSDGILELNKRLERNRVELEGRIADRERIIGEREDIIRDRERVIAEREGTIEQLRNIITRAGQLDRQAEQSIRRIEDILNKY
jgi:hypothetical protein